MAKQMDAFQHMMKASSRRQASTRHSSRSAQQSRSGDRSKALSTGRGGDQRASEGMPTQHAQHTMQQVLHTLPAQAVHLDSQLECLEQRQFGSMHASNQRRCHGGETATKRARVAASPPALCQQHAMAQPPAKQVQQAEKRQPSTDVQMHQATAPRPQHGCAADCGPSQHGLAEAQSIAAPAVHSQPSRSIWDGGGASSEDKADEACEGALCETWEEWESGEEQDEDGEGAGAMCETVRVYGVHEMQAMLKGEEQEGQPTAHGTCQALAHLSPYPSPPVIPAAGDPAAARDAKRLHPSPQAEGVIHNFSTWPTQHLSPTQHAQHGAAGKNQGLQFVSTAGQRQRVADWSHAAQPFSYLAVLDMEATCNAARNWAPVEVIEIACVVVRLHDLTVVGECQRYVRPTERPHLDPYCTRLTGITQQQVDTAQPLSQVLPELGTWLSHTCEGVGPEGVLPVTWSSWDLQVCLPTECKWRQLVIPRALRRWCDLRKTYTRAYKAGHNLRGSVEAAGLVWVGRPHSGLDDARNTAALMTHLIRNKGVTLSVTAAFDDAPPVHSPPPANRGLKQLQLQRPAAPAARHKAQDPQGVWNRRCGCGVPAALRTVKKPGPHLGRAFYSCGRWRILEQTDTCGFFKWADEVGVHNKGYHATHPNVGH